MPLTVLYDPFPELLLPETVLSIPVIVLVLELPEFRLEEEV